MSSTLIQRNLSSLPKELIYKIATYLPLDGHSLINLFSAVGIPFTQRNVKPILNYHYQRMMNVRFKNLFPENFQEGIPYSEAEDEKPSCIKALVNVMRHIECLSVTYFKDDLSDLQVELTACLQAGAHPSNIAVNLCRYLPNLHQLHTEDSSTSQALYWEEIQYRQNRQKQNNRCKLNQCLRELRRQYAGPFVQPFSDLYKKIQLLALFYNDNQLQKTLEKVRLGAANQLDSIHYQNYLDDLIPDPKWRDRGLDIELLFDRLNLSRFGHDKLFKTHNQNIPEIKKMLTELILMQDDCSLEKLQEEDFYPSGDPDVLHLVLVALFYAQVLQDHDHSENLLLKVLMKKLNVSELKKDDLINRFDKNPNFENKQFLINYIKQDHSASDAEHSRKRALSSVDGEHASKKARFEEL